MHLFTVGGEPRSLSPTYAVSLAVSPSLSPTPRSLSRSSLYASGWHQGTPACLLLQRKLELCAALGRLGDGGW